MPIKEMKAEELEDELWKSNYSLKVKVEKLDDILRRGLTDDMKITEYQYVNFHEAVWCAHAALEDLASTFREGAPAGTPEKEL